MTSRCFLFLLFTVGIVEAQDPASLISGDPLACFAMQGAPASNLTLVNVTGMPFSQAMHVVTGDVSSSANPWDIRPRCFNTLPANQSDTVLATFWIRATNAPGGLGFASFVVEENVSPYNKSAANTVTAGPDWKKVQIPFAIFETYSTSGLMSGGFNISFWVTYPHQEIEIGGLSVLDYGPNVPFSSLNLPNWPYEGHAPDAAWRADADARIEAIRKAGIVVVVQDGAGNPIPGAAIHVRMKRHAFGFGTAVAGDALQSGNSDGAKYREAIPRLFNKVVFENSMKWPYWEQSWGRQQSDATFAWLGNSGISMVRGHNVIWPGKSNLPGDVVSMLNATPVDQAQLRARIDTHFGDVMNYAKGRVTEWDVLNEPYANKDVQAVLGDAEMARWFQEARDLDPSVKLYINDYNILEAGGNDVSHQNGYFNIIESILANGGPIDGIGLQSHFDVNLTPPAKVLEILDRFATFGKDLQVTEFDVDPNDEQLQADYTADFLTACFSHPAIKGFMTWGFWEGAHWRPKAAMIRRDWTTRPSYEVWNSLLFQKWWTDVQGTSDDQGTFQTRGFLGDYAVDITYGGVTRTLPLTVVQGDVPNYLISGGN